MTRRSGIPFSLARRRIRSSFNKYNLFNAVSWRFRPRPSSKQTFFSKQETRSYHGENLTETQLRNIFSGRLNALDSLRSSRETEISESKSLIPWALQGFVAVERRLDTAIFRAMFASSVRQAAQFIKQGAVRVDNARVRHSGFQLKPGNMISVDPEKVLYALGRQKPSLKESIELTNRQIIRYNRYIKRCRKNPRKMWARRLKNRERHIWLRLKDKEALAKHNDKVYADLKTDLEALTPASVLEKILSHQVELRGQDPPALFGTPAINKIRSILDLAIPRQMSSKSEAKNTNDRSEIKEQDVTSKNSSHTESKHGASPLSKDQIDKLVKGYTGKSEGSGKALPSRSDVRKLLNEVIVLAEKDLRDQRMAQLKTSESLSKYDESWTSRLPNPLPRLKPEQIEENPDSIAPIALPYSPTGKIYGRADPTKKYFTPWAPRQFLAPFCILPHHLEVSFETCHAVYLRDPVARTDHSEVISPFPLDMHERAYMFYARKRRKNLRD